MGQDEKARYEHLPIPTYEEATSSRPTSSHSRGPEEISDDAEREGLLQERRDNAVYRQPTADSPRPSEDSDLDLHEMTGGGDGGEEEAAVRRSMEQMDLMEPDDATRTSTRRTTRFTKPFAQLTHRISTSFRALRLPAFNFSFITDKLPLPILARVAALVTMASIVYALFAFNIIVPNRAAFGARFDPESVRARVQAEADPTRIADYLEYITSFDHVAGTEGDLFLAEWIREMWTTADLDKVGMREYFVYLNYPTKDGRGVAIVDPPEKRWVAKLEEDDAYTGIGRDKQQTLNWHGHSRNGNVTGPLIYANGGSREDFQKLKDMGIDLKGSIALVRYYHTQGDRALKVKAAELAGAAGCIIYSDPKEDGFVRGTPLPEGRWRPSDAVQRGGVSLMSWVVGDVLTPGWASTEKAKRISEHDNPGLPNIPSIPLAWRDAQVLLQSLQGHGKKVPDGDWVGGVPDVEWWTGDPTSPKVNLMNLNDENRKQRIWNVHGLINGIETPEKRITVGNHRDAWCFGALDPGSGSAVMMEVVNIFATLKRIGWRPLRSIEFISWDAEEYNLIGSTEYVEDHIDALRANGVAYLNVDVGVSGSKFQASASPLFLKPLLHVIDRVTDPLLNATLRQLWDDSNSQLEGLGAGSDYVAFQDLAGTSSIDFGFANDDDYDYPYHSCHETYEYMTKFVDPGFHYHRALAQVWALLILELADRPILPFDLNVYASKIHSYVSDLETTIASSGLPSTANVDVSPLRQAADVFTQEAKTFHAFDDVWAQQVMQGNGGYESNAFALKRVDHNRRLADFETDLLDLPETGESPPYGVPNRQQFKHILFAPQAWSGYDAGYFPAVRDALDVGDWSAAQKLLERAARILTRASRRLNE